MSCLKEANSAGGWAGCAYSICDHCMRVRTCRGYMDTCELQSKLLKGGFIEDYIGNYYKAYEGV